MSKKPDGGPAFPLQFSVEPNSNKPDGTMTGPDERCNYIDVGMSLRDWFAGQALAGLAMNLSPQQVEHLSHGIKGGAIEAKAAQQLADAMIAERIK